MCIGWCTVDLTDVYEAYRAEPRLEHLRQPHIVLVPGEGPSRPLLFIVGEAPGATENTAVRPFVGASGRVIRSLISDAAELPIDRCWITNVVKYRPPGNRTPTPEEVAASVPYLRQEYVAVGSPPILVAVGAVAKRALLPESREGILATAGQPVQLSGSREIWCMVHPAYGLRNESFRPTMENHWWKLGQHVRAEYLSCHSDR